MEIKQAVAIIKSEIESCILASVFRRRTSANKVQVTFALSFKKWRQALIPANHKALSRITEKKKRSSLKHDQSELDNPSPLLTDISKGKKNIYRIYAHS